MTPLDVEVVVIGAGAAGLVAAERAASRGRRTLLLEKNRKPGVKILISGGTRCNLTHATDRRGIVAAFGKQGRFLHSALAALSPQDLVGLVEAEGVATQVEAHGKIFPCSGRAADVLAAFVNRLQRSGATYGMEESVLDIRPMDRGFEVKTSQRTIHAARVVVAVGGQSYPKCGTTGDGYRWAEQLGHTLAPTHPALTPITTDAPWRPDLQGVTIPDVEVGLYPLESPGQGRPMARGRGSFLFTHFGVSGPVALDISREISHHPQPRSLCLLCDFLPNQRAEATDQQLRDGAGSQSLARSLPATLPRRLLETLLLLQRIDGGMRMAELRKEDRQRVIASLHRFLIPVSGTRGYQKAEVTAGGVVLEEVDSRTMESKRVPHLYFAGEVLDLDGPIGGYNFQAAFSTGWLAGLHV